MMGEFCRISPFFLDHCRLIDVRHRIVAPHPPITRALNVAREKLVAAGVKVVDWKPFETEKIATMTVSVL